VSVLREGSPAIAAAPSAAPTPPAPPGASVDGHRVRPEVQALRALAVTSVVVYHFEPRLLPGGYAGLDVFFVSPDS